MRNIFFWLCLILLIAGSVVGYAHFSKNDMTEALLQEEKTASPLVSQDQPLPQLNIDRLIVFKAKRQMWAYHGEQLVKIYPIALGFNPVGHKQFEGDGKTPEGIYRINERNPNSSYHKNLGISYPNDADKAYAVSNEEIDELYQYVTHNAEIDIRP